MAKKKSAGRNTRPALSSLELEVMDIVWELGDCLSAEVTAEFAKKRPLAPTTIRTVLASLRKKGYLKPIPTTERGFRLRATVRREAVARRSLKNLLSLLFHDSPRQAIAYLLDDENLTDSELEELRRTIDKRKQEGKR